jgi:hypothetical protein
MYLSFCVVGPRKDRVIVILHIGRFAARLSNQAYG